MKKSFKNLKITNYLLVLFFLTFKAIAGTPVAMVHSVTGNVFAVVDGSTKLLTAGDHIQDFSEVITEVGGQIVFSDYFDHQYHLSGSGHIKFMNKLVELKRGYFWTKSLSPTNDNFYIQTANSVTTYNNGEAVVSFDAYAGKSQILVIKGEYEFGNSLQKHLTTPVREGQFSFIHDEHEEGSPRKATPIGFSSYKKVMALFKNTDSMKKVDERRFIARPTVVKKTARTIASVENNPIEASLNSYKKPVPSRKEGRIIVIKRNDQEDELSKRNEQIRVYQKEVNRLKVKVAKATKKFSPSYTGSSNVETQIFGETSPKIVQKKVRKKSVRKRMPASVQMNIPTQKTISSKDIFESGLMNQFKKQMRHTSEVNNLIDELESFDQDFQKKY